jgi:hypothetical protein
MTTLEQEFQTLVDEFVAGARKTFAVECGSSKQGWRIKSRFYAWRKPFPPDHPARRVSIGLAFKPSVVIEFSYDAGGEKDAQLIALARQSNAPTPSSDSEATLNDFFSRVGGSNEASS